MKVLLLNESVVATCERKSVKCSNTIREETKCDKERIRLKSSIDISEATHSKPLSLTKE